MDAAPKDLPALTRDYQRDWPAYFDAVAGQPPRETLVRALDAFEREDADAAEPVLRTAVDVGCGEGRDTRAMLARGGSTRWRVMACDASHEGLRRLESSLFEHSPERYALEAMPMEKLAAAFSGGVQIGISSRSDRRVDFVNASFALPFCEEDAFPALWDWIVGLILPGGRFAGQLFGERDEWAAVNPRRHVSRARALELLGAFELEHFDEVEKTGADAMGGEKRHHLFHIVGRKKGEALAKGG